MEDLLRLTASQINQKQAIQMLMIRQGGVNSGTAGMIDGEIAMLRVTAEKVAPFLVNHQLLQSNSIHKASFQMKTEIIPTCNNFPSFVTSKCNPAVGFPAHEGMVKSTPAGTSLLLIDLIRFR